MPGPNRNDRGFDQDRTETFRQKNRSGLFTRFYRTGDLTGWDRTLISDNRGEEYDLTNKLTLWRHAVVTSDDV